MIFVGSCFCPCLQNYVILEQTSFGLFESHKLGLSALLLMPFLSFQLLPKPLLPLLFTPSLPHRGQWPSHCCHLDIVFFARLATLAPITGLATLPKSAIFVSLGSEQFCCQRFDGSPASWWVGVQQQQQQQQQQEQVVGRGSRGTSLHAIVGPARPPGTQACLLP